MLGEGEQRFQRMITIRATAADVEGKVDLGVGRLAEQDQGFLVLVSRPEASLLLIRAATFSSA